MRIIENDCVGCPPELGCIAEACPYRNALHIYCDICGDDAVYQIDDEELCEECAKKRILETFNNFGIYEQADMLDLGLYVIGG